MRKVSGQRKIHPNNEASTSWTTARHPFSIWVNDPESCAFDLLDDGGGRDGRSARQILYMADISELIELSCPVIPHHEDVGTIFLQIVTFKRE
jgi:hypothetical protein